METLTTSQKERRRVGIMAGVKAGDLSVVEASEVLGLSYRQTERVGQRYRTGGDAGLVHRLRGRPGAAAQAGATAGGESGGRCAEAGNATGNGANASRVLGRWCNWTGRIMTGLKGGGGSVW